MASSATVALWHRGSSEETRSAASMVSAASMASEASEASAVSAVTLAVVRVLMSVRVHVLVRAVMGVAGR